MYDGGTKFLGSAPSTSKSHERVIAALHAFDADVPVIRRLWSDSAPEFKRAAYEIMKMRCSLTTAMYHVVPKVTVKRRDVFS